MNPERFLGRDPAPGSLAAVDDGAAVLRETVLVLSAGRGRLDATVVDSPWRGTHAAPVVDAVGDLRGRFDVLESAVVDFSAAWQEWRHGLARRRDRTAELVEVLSQLDGDDTRRDRVLQQADELAEEHRAAAAVLAAAADELAQTATVASDEADVAHGLRRGFDGLDEAVQEWVLAHGAETSRAGAAVTAVSGLTAVVPHLLGVADDADDDAADAAGVRELAGSAPGSHRLLDALDRPPSADDHELAAASFAPASAPSIGDRLRGGPRTPEDVQPDAASDDWGDLS